MIKSEISSLSSSLLTAIQETNKSKEKLIFQKKEINQIINLIFKKIKLGGKLIFCGNGGSAADAQHLAAEFLIRLRPKVNRKPIQAISLALDTSTITACGNDYDFDKIFSRPFQALVKKNDVLIAISTSGNSKNIIEVLKEAKKKKILSISFLGFQGGKAKNHSQKYLIIKSNNVARIQETHIFLGHFILEKVEDLLLKNKII
ncbi:D-sedoheptulose-7-phosphate isomerase [Candidatus Pelagibacter sp. HIMB1782]|uniref:D-sedoheptulose-7-phosphate isomerase n=1 Tax=Candidatus Pelagibacter sp. HIMB1782 TaxID=3413375 RepID=UPI003F8762B5